jgi:hypothetical protein
VITSNPILAAAAPSLITALEALQQFETDMGPDPLAWVAKYPGAKLKLLGTLALQLPQIAAAEGGALETVINTTTSSWITKLKALPVPGATA